MDALTAARAQMEVSLGFHMIFSAIGIALPAFMSIAEALYLRTGQAHYLSLAKTWAKATSLLFAVGAVSGTALSFELGLLWPRFMQYAGSSIGSAFALEGYAFFVEAIFIGIYLYGWDRVSPRAHWLAGVVVALSGTASGVLVIAANSWMQSPQGFDPLAPFRSGYWLPMSLHTTSAAYVSVAFAIAGIYAAGMLRRKPDERQRAAMRLAMVVGAGAAILQLASGDIMARVASEHQPAKLAAMEALYQSQRGAPLLLGGIPDDRTETVRYGLEIPSGLSLLLSRDPDAEVRGLDAIPRDERPPTLLVHWAFDLMVVSGMGLLAAGALYWGMRFLARKRDFEEPPWLLRVLCSASPLGFVGIETGWIVSEVGRQPWIVFGLMRTRDAVTIAPGVQGTFYLFVLLYAALGTALVVLLRRLRHVA